MPKHGVREMRKRIVPMGICGFVNFIPTAMRSQGCFLIKHIHELKRTLAKTMSMLYKVMIQWRTRVVETCIR